MCTIMMPLIRSGKTAAFLIPMLELLKGHSAKVGVRAIVMSPTRELALQTLKFTKSMKKHTDLRTAVVLGGDSMDRQVRAGFAMHAVHGNSTNDNIVAMLQYDV